MRSILAVAGIAWLGLANAESSPGSQGVPQCTSRARSSIAWRQTDTIPGDVSGRVIGIDGASPIRNAVVSLEPGAARVATSADGSFRLQLPSTPGRYHLRVQSIGMIGAQDSLYLTGRNGMRLLVTLVAPEGDLREC